MKKLRLPIAVIWIAAAASLAGAAEPPQQIDWNARPAKPTNRRYSRQSSAAARPAPAAKIVVFGAGDPSARFRSESYGQEAIAGAPRPNSFERGGLPGSYGRFMEGTYGQGGVATRGVSVGGIGRGGIPGSYSRFQEGSYGQGSVAASRGYRAPHGGEGIPGSYDSSDEGSYGHGAVSTGAR